MMSPQASLIFPLYQAENLLDPLAASLVPFLKHSAVGWECLFVCDGCTDATERRLGEIAAGRSNWRIIGYPANRGKGHAIKRGIQEARGRVVAYTDADLAYPLDQLESYAADVLEERADLVVANRIHDDSRFLMSYRIFPYILMRHYSSRFFNQAARLMLGLPYLDFQAGFKAFDRAKLQPVVDQIRSDRFGFDLELMTRAHHRGLRVLERPAYFKWERVASTVGMAGTGWELFRTIARLRWTLGKARRD